MIYVASILALVLGALGLGAWFRRKGRLEGLREAETQRRQAVAKATVEIAAKEKAIDVASGTRLADIQASGDKVLASRPSVDAITKLIEESKRAK